MKKYLILLKVKKKDMKLVIGLMDKSLLLSEAIEQVLANVKGKKYINLNKNLYHFINKEKYKFIKEYDLVCFNYFYLDAKQNTFKIYINTFYSIAGESDTESSEVQLIK